MKKIPTTLFAFYFHFARLFWVRFVAIACMAVAWSFFQSSGPYFIKLLIDRVQAYQPLEAEASIFKSIQYPLLGFIGSRILIECANIIQGIIGLYTFPAFRAKLASEIFTYVQNHSYNYFANQFGGGISSRITELARSGVRVISLLLQDFLPIIAAFFASACYMWQVHPLFAGIVIIWIVLYLAIVILLVNRKCLDYARQHSASSSMVKSRIIDALNNIAIIRLFAHSRYEQKYLEQYLDIDVQNNRRSQAYIEWIKVFQGIAASVLVVTMLLLAVWGWTHHQVTLGDFSFIAMSLLTMIGLVSNIANQAVKFFEELGAASDALAILSDPIEVGDEAQAQALKIAKGKIAFENIVFDYPSSQQKLFENLNCTIEGGEKIGLVGFSGSGKTTFVHLLLRYFNLKSGHILIDGQDISKVLQESLRRQIAMIPQDSTLFHRSVMENIRYGRTDATDEEVIAAAQQVACHEFIEKLPQGYETLVGERGIKLSGGQRQRISIARAVLKNSPILVLDEATSALDSITEQKIQEALNQIMHNRTTIVIAHRLSTLLSMDRILVFHEGKIVESGRCEQLLREGGYFARLWEMQSGGFLPESFDGIEPVKEEIMKEEENEFESEH